MHTFIKGSVEVPPTFSNCNGAIPGYLEGKQVLTPQISAGVDWALKKDLISQQKKRLD
jgi:hypothetical protein